mgnify:CR=1 FL=1
MVEKYKAGAEHKGKYVTYIRVSTNRQGLSGLGLEAQTKAIDAYLNGGDWEIIESFEDMRGDKRNVISRKDRSLGT